MKQLVLGFSLLPCLAWGQTYSTSGQNWSGSYAFPSASDRSLVLQQAQVINDAENPTAAAQTNYYITNDNRTGYVEVTTDGDVTTDLQIGDEIGQQTYAVGSLNTGTTDVSVEGDGNIITADNTADNSGCIDASILSSLQTPEGDAAPDVSSLSVLDLADALAAFAAGNCN
mgnify:FL=1